MKEILFRGQKISTKEWVYGSLIINKSGNHTITQVIENPVHLGTLSGWCFGVIPETVGQYIDTINGIKVFDGDIFCIKHSQNSYFVKIEDDLQAICYHTKHLDWDDKSPLRWGPLYRIKELGWDNEFHLTGNIHETN